MKVLFINNDGGFANHIAVQDRMTVGELFDQRMRHGDPEAYLIRINRLSASTEQVLREGDRVSFTSVRIEGAA